jgi:hypothetical protein
VLVGLAGVWQPSSAQRQAAPPAATAQWNATAAQVATLQVAGKHAEALKLLQGFVAKNPTVADAQCMLGSAHRDLSNPLLNQALTPASRKTHLDGAVTHFQRALDLTRDAGMRYAILMMLTTNFELRTSNFELWWSPSATAFWGDRCVRVIVDRGGLGRRVAPGQSWFAPW